MRSQPISFVSLLLVLAALMLFVSPPLAQATDQDVSDCADNGGANQLRARLAAAQGSGGGTITFSCGPATIVLQNGVLPTITTNTTINGGGKITISGNNASRIFVVNAGATLTLNNIIIRDAHQDAGDGGAVFVNNNGALTITASKFYSNTTSSSAGGGAITSYGALNISGSEFAFNKAGGGGALNTVFGGANAVISNSNFHDNATLSAHGGAIYIRDAAPMTLNHVTLTKNKALNQGGAIFVSGSGSSLTLNNSHVVSNTALSSGGGIYSYGALNVLSSTVEYNDADSAGGGLVVENTAFMSGTNVYSNTSFAGGGGLNASATATLTMMNSTVDQNYTYAGNGGGIRSLGTLVLTDTFVTHNFAEAGPGDTYGGGIYHEGGTLRLIGNVSSNRAKHGAAVNLNSGTAKIKSSFIAFNRAVGGDGGALRIGGGSMALDGSTIFGNTADNNGGGIFNQGSLTVTQTGISINHAPRYGGGIYQASGSMTLTNSTIDSNDTPGFGTGDGGGIYNAGGTMALSNSMVDWNAANYRGGGILNFATLTLDRTLVRNNISYGGDSSQATFGGGGIYNFGNATVTNSTVRDNSTSAQDGGGFYNGWYANATLTKVTLSNNSAKEDGGGFKNNLGTATLTNVTISGNTANADGGGIYNDQAQTNLRHVTLSGNSAANGGGIYNLSTESIKTVSLQNTILAKSLNGKNCSTISGSVSVVSQGYNLSDDDSLGVFCPMTLQSSDQNNTTAKLTALGDYGGPTVGSDPEPMLTHLPQPGSPAIDQILGGVNGCGSTFTKDQRGVNRPQDGDGNGGFACDIGAVEVKPNEVTPTPTPTRTRTPTRTPTKTPTRTPTPACNVKPNKPILKAPANNAVLTTLRPKLKWNAANCAKTYKVVVKNAVTKVTADKKLLNAEIGVTVYKYKTDPLAAGEQYKWFVKACNGAFGCAKSAARFFTIQ